MTTTPIKPVCTLPVRPVQPHPDHGGGLVPPWLQWPIVLPIVDEPVHTLPIDETLFVPEDWR